ncbi:MFS transporter [Pseudomonas nunensis]|nr:MFS transporter [Pseudomonas nunensis]KPN90371.1 class III aminotransferase [Pseudomonas nunensis]MCL5225634.1 MFS transporter [Pseudomonas nunensis]UTO16614.1 MFS transporter [Pseudomonas nunensis]
MIFKSARPDFSLGRGFYFLWMGESLAVIGTALMEFALGVWVYNHTGSAVAFANVVLAATLPAIIFLPLAGGLADRVSHKVIIVCSDVLLAAMLFVVMALLWTDRLEPLHLYVFNALASIVSSFRQPAYQAAVNSIVKPDKFTRASGLMGISKNASALVGPLLAGILMAQAGLVTIVAIDLITFCSGTLLVIKAFSHARAPVIKSGGASAGSVMRGAVRNVTDALGFFKTERLMAGLLVYTMLRNALLSMVTLMITPLLLSMHTSQTLGVVYTWAALGGLSGAGLLIFVGNPGRLMVLIACADLVLSLCVVSIGLVSGTTAYCAVVFVAIAAASVADGGVSALWMRKIPTGSRASVFALISMLIIAATSIAIFGGGLIVDHWFQPALEPGGRFVESIGGWLGVGKGRGVALLFVVAGAVSVLLCLGTLIYRPMRRLDRLVRDEDSSALTPADAVL